MRVFVVTVMAFIILVGLPAGSDAHNFYERGVRVHNASYNHLDNVSIDLDDGSIILSHDNGRRYETLEITEDYELYINDERIDLDEDQQVLVKAYYDLGMEIVEYAKKIGIEGAKIGLGGAKLGLKAVGSIFKLIFTDYDTEEFERDMERAAARLEARAEVLEEKAEVIEDMAEELADIAYEMNCEIPEVEELDWF